MNRLIFLLPLFFFVILLAFFSYRLVLMHQGEQPDFLPSVLIGHSIPQFSLPEWDKTEPLTTDGLKGKVILINFFASWCETCQAEHPYLLALKHQGFISLGIDYKDDEKTARAFLARKGNPYDRIVSDKDGAAAIDFGLYGVPETYLIDKQGIIKFREPGPLTPETIRDRLLPLIEELSK